MKRVWGHVLAGLSVMAGACAIFSACSHDDSTIFVRNVLAQQLVTNGQSCLFTSDPTQPFISSGVLDVDFRHEYDAVVLVGNQLVQEVNSSQLQTETSIVTIQGAVVRITDSAGNQLKSFTRLTSATINPASGGTPSFSPIGVTILDHDTVESDPTIQSSVLTPPAGLGSVVRLVSYVRFFGKTLGGESVESNEFEFPIDICKACLIGFAPSDINPGCPAPNCFGTGTTSTQLPLPCTPGEDVVVDCSQCQGIADCHGAVPPPATVSSCLLSDAGAG